MTKAREVQVVVLNKGMERGTIALLTELFERMAAAESNIREMAVFQLAMVQQLELIVDGAGAIRKEVERMQGRHQPEDDDLPPLAS